MQALKENSIGSILHKILLQSRFNKKKMETQNVNETPAICCKWKLKT